MKSTIRKNKFGKIPRFLKQEKLKHGSSVTNPILGVPEPNGLKHLKKLETPFWIQVRGGSMRPTLVDGDFVRVVPLKSVEHQLLQCGMLVFRLNPGNQNTVVHRLVGIGDKFLFESGDHSRIVHPFSREHLIGMITHVKRSGIIHPMEIPLLWRIRNWMEALKSRI